MGPTGPGLAAGTSGTLQARGAVKWGGATSGDGEHGAALPPGGQGCGLRRGETEARPRPLHPPLLPGAAPSPLPCSHLSSKVRGAERGGHWGQGPLLKCRGGVKGTR